MAYATALQIKTANQIAQRFALEDADGLKVEGDMAADYAARMLHCMRAAGATTSVIDAVKEALTDAFGDVQGGINKVLDDQGLCESDHQIDLSEIEAA